MSSRMKPKTLAKTLCYVACIAPHEYGLFWDPEGSMPWKEFYWAIQEDPKLRFVRQATIKELEFLGISLPFYIDGNRLKLRDADSCPVPMAVEPPARLYFGLRVKQYGSIQRYGLKPDGHRKYVPLTDQRETALRIAARRDPKALVAEVLAKEAHNKEDLVFLKAGEGFYLTTVIPARYVILPILKDDTPKQKKKAKAAEPKQESRPSAPGSFFLKTSHVDFVSGEQDLSRTNRSKRRRKGSDWKRKSRKERRKREL